MIMCVFMKALEIYLRLAVPILVLANALVTRAQSLDLDFSALHNPVWVSADNLRDPSVLKTADGYQLFYSRFSNQSWAAPTNWAIAQVFTRDFVHFE